MILYETNYMILSSQRTNLRNLNYTFDSQPEQSIELNVSLNSFVIGSIKFDPTKQIPGAYRHTMELKNFGLQIGELHVEFMVPPKSLFKKQFKDLKLPTIHYHNYNSIDQVSKLEDELLLDDELEIKQYDLDKFTLQDSNRFQRSNSVKKEENNIDDDSLIISHYRNKISNNIKNRKGKSPKQCENAFNSDKITEFNEQKYLFQCQNSPGHIQNPKFNLTTTKPESFHFGTTPKFCNKFNDIQSDLLNQNNKKNDIKFKNEETIQQKNLRQNNHKYNQLLKQQQEKSHQNFKIHPRKMKADILLDDVESSNQDKIDQNLDCEIENNNGEFNEINKGKLKNQKIDDESIDLQINKNYIKEEQRHNKSQLQSSNEVYKNEKNSINSKDVNLSQINNSFDSTNDTSVSNKTSFFMNQKGTIIVDNNMNIDNKYLINSVRLDHKFLRISDTLLVNKMYSRLSSNLNTNITKKRRYNQTPFNNTDDHKAESEVMKIQNKAQKNILNRQGKI